MASNATIQRIQQDAKVLTEQQAAALRGALADRLLVVCFGSGVDSTAMLVALHAAGLRPEAITFADTGGEKPETIAHLDAMNAVLDAWRWPRTDVVRKVPLASTGYDTLEGNCLANETLPSLAFGMKSCSMKWKQGPQDQFLKGVKSGQNAAPPHPLWIRAETSGEKIVKLIGYDCGRADLRRSSGLKQTDGEFDFAYPLQLIGWAREDCVRAIASTLGPQLVPIKSACFFCPASKKWERWCWSVARSPVGTAGSIPWSSATPGRTWCAMPRASPAPRPRSAWAGVSPGTTGRASTTWSTPASTSGAMNSPSLGSGAARMRNGTQIIRTMPAPLKSARHLLSPSNARSATCNNNQNQTSKHCRSMCQ